MDTIAIVYVLGLAVLAVVLLATEKAPLTVLGTGLVLAVAIPGLVDTRDALAGFANPAVVTVAALYVVGAGFLRTGAATLLADRILARTGDREPVVVFVIMAIAAALSAFVNNTLVVVTLMPVITGICTRARMFPSRLLIPLSFASILGGMCTLVGTSTTLLVHGVLLDMGLPGLSMFEVTPVGLCLAGVGLVYLLLIGRRLLPRIPTLASQGGGENLKEYVTEITIGRNSRALGRPIGSLGETLTPGVTRPVMLVRKGTLLWPPFDGMFVQEGDILIVSGSSHDLAALQREKTTDDERGRPRAGGSRDHYDPATMSFFELVAAPGSSLLGRRIGELGLKSRYDAAVVALMRRGEHLRSRVSDLYLQTGDVLLAFGTDKARARLRASEDLHVIEGVHEEIYHVDKAPTACAIILGVLALFVTGVLDTAIAALTGAVAMVVTRCLSVREAHGAINWPILVFIAGTLALSKAVVSSGAAALVADQLASGLGGMGPSWLLAGTFIGCILLTEMLSNNAVAILMTPIAVATAAKAGVDYRPLVLAVALGASCSFANPMGYKTNLLVLGPGGYRFRDYLRAGLPLDLLLVIAGALLLPWVWPL